MVAQRAPQDHEQHQHACGQVVLKSLACIKGNKKKQTLSIASFCTWPSINTPRPDKQDRTDSRSGLQCHKI